MVGFSRGAYTVRCLANLIADVGILKRTSLGKLHYLYQNWVELKPGTRDEASFKQDLDKLQQDDKLSRDISVEACSVWETVGSIGLPASLMEAPQDFISSKLRKTSTKHEKVPPRLKYAFHAVALNEYRKDYKPVMWAGPPGATDIKQCWFLGTHSDIGGGHDSC